MKDKISKYYKKDMQSAELMIREAFLRACRDILDSHGVEEIAIDQITGAIRILEQFKEMSEEK
jgi:hypothetical protein